MLTTVFTKTTELAAVELLAALPHAQVKVSYDERRTRLHAKAWLFYRDTELHTAYVGSANLTSTALGSGQEWMIKACYADLPAVIEKFKAPSTASGTTASSKPSTPRVKPHARAWAMPSPKPTPPHRASSSPSGLSPSKTKSSTGSQANAACTAATATWSSPRRERQAVHRVARERVELLLIRAD